MTIRVQPPSQPLRIVLQRAGYTWNRGRLSGDEYYVRRLGPLLYPRFHLYVVEEPQQVRLNLHLDQKQPSYQGTAKHAGEYEGEVVEREVERLGKFFM